jgi:uncharacterized RDD family membrane protein YckC
MPFGASAGGGDDALPPAGGWGRRVAPFAGFWIRVLARLIDGVLLWVVGQVLAGLLVAAFVPDALGALSLEPGAEPTGEQLIALAAVFGIVMASSW